MGTKFSLLFIFTALCLFMAFGQSVNAQTPTFTPAPTPFAVPTGLQNEQPTCGFAGTAPACCVSKDHMAGGIGAAKEAVNNIPLVGGAANGLLDGIGNIASRQLPQALPVLQQQCYYGSPVVDASSNCTCQLAVAPTPMAQVGALCKKYIESQPSSVTDPDRAKRINDEYQACKGCAERGGFYSSMGCVPLNLSNFLSNFILQLGIGFAGMVALLCIIYSAFILQTSGGSPERIKTAQEQLTSCIVGLMMVIFSVFIMRLIGIDILRLPGFMGN